MSDETKKERFERIAKYRTDKVLDSLRVLGNLSNRNNYKYTEKEVNKIFRTINRYKNTVKKMFKDTTPNEFTL